MCACNVRVRLCAVQVVLFANDTTVSKGMVKYTSQIPKESIVDVQGVVTCPDNPVESCSQSQVRTQQRWGAVERTLVVRALV